MAPLEKPRRPVCKYYLQNNCARGTTCPYYHQRTHDNSSLAVPSTAICLYYMNGSCVFGSQCRQLHPAEHEKLIPRQTETPAGTLGTHPASTFHRLNGNGVKGACDFS